MNVYNIILFFCENVNIFFTLWQKTPSLPGYQAEKTRALIHYVCNK